jgi:hypothetical protein
MNAPFNLEKGFRQMTAEQRIKRHILLQALAENDDLKFDGEITAENIDDVYAYVLCDIGLCFKYEEKFRGSGEPSGINTQSSFSYEKHDSIEMVRQLSDGTWVGWTYWHGRSGIGDPATVDWMLEAYDVEMHEETRVVKVFARKDVGESQ